MHFDMSEDFDLAEGGATATFTQEGVESLQDLAYFLTRATNAAGWDYVEGCAFIDNQDKEHGFIW